MKLNQVKPPLCFLDSSTGALRGQKVVETRRYIKDLVGFFEDESARTSMPPDQLLYEVQAIFPVAKDAEGGLFFGRTVLYPGLVGEEYFMTKGHFHRKSDRGEYYWCLRGEGMLILMDRERKTRAEKMTPGSLHYIPGHTAHRTANTSDEPLIFGACWPADAGHDYEEILTNGFSARLKIVDGQPQLVY